MECARGHAANPEASSSGDLELAGHEDFSPLHLLTFLLAWPKQAKIGPDDPSCSRTARHELKCLLYGQGTSEITDRQSHFPLSVDKAAVAV